MIKTQQELINKALDLVGKVPPEFNMTPTIELVREAWSMGYDVIRAGEPVWIDDGSRQSNLAHTHNTEHMMFYPDCAACQIEREREVAAAAMQNVQHGFR